MRLIVYPILLILLETAASNISGCAAFHHPSRFLSHLSCSNKIHRRSPFSSAYQMSEDASSSSSTSTTSTPIFEQMDDNDDDMISMPWSEWQDWALRDNLPKYLITIPPPQFTTSPNVRSRQLALWRSMIRDVPELNGYNVGFVRQMHAKQLLRKNTASPGTSTKIDTPGVLPMLEQFEFEPNDGISGIVFGLPGIADGTKMTTPPLKHVQQTIPLGYVYTDQGGDVIAYEIGTPRQVELYSLDGTSTAAKAFFNAAVETSSKLGEQASGSRVALAKIDPDTSQMLLNLGGLTAIVLGGATAVNMLSHHLTVNVFWV